MRNRAGSPPRRCGRPGAGARACRRRTASGSTGPGAVRRRPPRRARPRSPRPWPRRAREAEAHADRAAVHDADRNRCVVRGQPRGLHGSRHRTGKTHGHDPRGPRRGGVPVGEREPGWRRPRGDRPPVADAPGGVGSRTRVPFFLGRSADRDAQRHRRDAVLGDQIVGQAGGGVGDDGDRSCHAGSVVRSTAPRSGDPPLSRDRAGCPESGWPGIGQAPVQDGPGAGRRRSLRCRLPARTVVRPPEPRAERSAPTRPGRPAPGGSATSASTATRIDLLCGPVPKSSRSSAAA